MKRILLMACIEKNIGDDLFIRLICERYPDVDFYISEKANYSKLNSIPNLHFESKISIWMFFSDMSGSYKITRRLPCALIEKIYRNIFIKYDGCVYIVGNAFKNYKYRGKYQTAWIKNMSKISSYTYLLSTNFGPYDNDLWVRDCGKIFNRMKDVCFRDKESYELFQQYDNIRYSPDAVLTYKVKDKYGEAKGNCLLISVIDCKFFARPLEIREASDKYERQLTDIIDYYLKKDYKVYILNSNMEQDFAASMRILKKCDNNSNIEIINYNGDFQVVEMAYKKAKFVIGTRLHSVILSWIYNVPVIPIIYDIKIYNILNSYEFNGKYYYINNLMGMTGEQCDKDFDNYSFNINLIKRGAESQFNKLDLFLKENK